MKVYISGPIAGRPDGNRAAFAQVAESIRLAGHEPVNPHEVDHEHGTVLWDCFGRPTDRDDDEHKYGCYLLTDLVAMADCEAVVVLEDWNRSVGAKVEVAFAEAVGIPVYGTYELEAGGVLRSETVSKPAWMGKHPCVGCGVGYGECSQGYKMSLMCCKRCNHPTRWDRDPYTAEEIEEMKQH